jgi:hypothetical protein
MHHCRGLALVERLLVKAEAACGPRKAQMLCDVICAAFHVSIDLASREPEDVHAHAAQRFVAFGVADPVMVLRSVRFDSDPPIARMHQEVDAVSTDLRLRDYL